LIDLHCHILPALDDGAIDLADSVAMARQAAADGIEIVCATPHIRPDHDVRIEELDARIEVVNEELERAELPVRVVRGGEVAEPGVVAADDDDLRRVTLGGAGRWILLEPRRGPLGHEILDTVDDLRERGFRSVVAHPERHAGAGFRECLEGLVERGALIQVTAALIAEGPAAPTMLDLAGHGLVHLLGSDAHSSHGGRPVHLSSGLARLAEVECVRPHVDWVVREGPSAIVAGEETSPPFLPC
jgi:protein-tyrosine phosphatase